MKLFLSYLRLVRPFNLIMILFTLFLVRFFFVYAIVEFPKLHLQVSELLYSLYSLSFVFMAAAGYIINDYYDVEIDKINKPGRVIIGNSISTRSALSVYWILNGCGIITGFLSCYLAGVPLLGTLFLFYMAALWFYSYKLKGTFLAGNLLIGLCIALVPLGGACIELLFPAFQQSRKVLSWEIIRGDERSLVCQLMGGIAVFAFLSTVIREMVKDIEDMEGDSMAGCHTVPLVIGVKRTKWVVGSLLILLNILLGYIQYQFKVAGLYPFLYFLLFIQVPVLIALYKLRRASVSNHFHQISSWLKAFMLTGTVYLFGVAFYIYSVSLFFASLFN